MLAPEIRHRLTQQLHEARTRGFVGPGPVDVHLDHGEAMAAAVERDFRGRFLDLGSGGGVPGLVLLATWGHATATLLDARRRRCSFLEGALERPGMGGTGVRRLRSGRGAGACPGYSGRLRVGGGAGLRGTGDDGGVRGGIPCSGRPGGGERAPGHARPVSMAGGRSGRAGTEWSGAAIRRRSRGGDPDRDRAGGRAVAASGWGSGASPALVRRPGGAAAERFP